MGKRNLPEETELRAKLREVRNTLKRQISEFTDDDLRVDNLNGAIAHQWSVVGRLEAEFDAVPTDEDLILALEQEVTSEVNEETRQERITISTKTYNLLLNRLARLEAKCNRTMLLDALRKANRTLGQQQGEQVKMEETKARTEYIKIEAHAAVLAAMKDIFYLALRRLGYTDDDLRRLARELKRIEKDYPVIQEDYEKIRGRLFGEPEHVTLTLQEAEYEVLGQDPTSLERINQVIGHSTSRRGRKIDG